MRNRLLATTFFSASLALSGIAFAQTQHSTDAGVRNDPDAASDVHEGAAAPVIAPSDRTTTTTSTHSAVRVAPEPSQQATVPGPQHSTEDGKRNDPDAASDLREGETPKH